MIKNFFKCLPVVLAVVMGIVAPAHASAWDIKDVLSKAGVGETVGNLVEGVLSTSKVEVKDLAGEWVSDGSAVCFKSDNLLQKAGGIAAAAAVESKLNPYFEKLGLTGAVVTIQEDGSFTMKLKKLTLTGTLVKNEDGNFTASFKALKAVPLGTLTAYVQKSVNHVDIMFDATKLKTFISAIAKFTGISLAKSAASVLDAYEGLCVGFSLNKTGSVEKTEQDTEASSSKTSIGSILGNVLGGKKDSSSASSTVGAETEKTTATNSEQSKAASSQESKKSENNASKLGGALINILKSTGSK